MSKSQQRSPQQLWSHQNLVQNRAWVSPSWSKGPLDAIIVPAARPARWLREAANLAATGGVRLVVLASHLCKPDEVADLVASIPNCRATIVQVPEGYTHPWMTFETDSFVELSANRQSNLSMKRNIGLLLARLLGWRKILFLDDDIFGLTRIDLDEIADQLDHSRIAGMVCRRFPDNSVVCHAKRLAGLRQDNFLTGAALGVNVADVPLDFFPDVYNEDWFFMAVLAAQGAVISVGDARQKVYNPFDPDRAAAEEFGDVLAEGWYAWFGEGAGPSRPTTTHWTGFLGSRRKLIEEVTERLTHVATHEAVQAGLALDSSFQQLDRLRPGDCREFLAAFEADRKAFGGLTIGLSTGLDLSAALDRLGLVGQVASFAIPDTQDMWRELEGIRRSPRTLATADAVRPMGTATGVPRGARRPQVPEEACSLPSA